jgi:hypothetical protein
MAEIQLGVNNGFALKNWPEPMAWARIVAEDLGLRHVQFSFDLLDPMVPEPGRSAMCEEVVQAVQEFDLSMWTTFTGFIIYAQNQLAHPAPWVRMQTWRWFEASLEVTGKLGAEGAGGHIGAMTSNDFSNPERRAFIVRSLVDSGRGDRLDAGG